MLFHSQLPTYHSRPYQMDPPGANNAAAGPSTSAGAVNAGAGPSTSAGAVNAAPFSYMVRELLLAYVGNLHDVTHDSHPPSLPTYTHRLMMTI